MDGYYPETLQPARKYPAHKFHKFPCAFNAVSTKVRPTPTSLLNTLRRSVRQVTIRSGFHLLLVVQGLILFSRIQNNIVDMHQLETGNGWISG